MSAVVVTWQGGEHVFMDCTADEFEPGMLTITDARGEAVTIRPEGWRAATVYGVGGYPLFDITNALSNSEAGAESTRRPSTTDRDGGGHSCRQPQ